MSPAPAGSGRNSPGQVVVDASVGVEWVTLSGTPENRYAHALLESGLQPVVPGLFTLEVRNVLLRYERRGAITGGAVDAFFESLDALGLWVDDAPATHTATRALSYARQYQLTVYDAAYLELALRHDLPLATLDRDLQRAAASAGVTPYPIPVQR